MLFLLFDDRLLAFPCEFLVRRVSFAVLFLVRYVMMICQTMGNVPPLPKKSGRAVFTFSGSSEVFSSTRSFQRSSQSWKDQIFEAKRFSSLTAFDYVEKKRNKQTTDQPTNQQTNQPRNQTNGQRSVRSLPLLKPLLTARQLTYVRALTDS